VSYTLILDMPMKLGLKLMASVCSDCVDAEWEFVKHIINKLYGILLIVTRIDFQRPDSSCIINGCILKTSDAVAEAARKWTMRHRDWAMIYSQLMIFFEDRLGKYV